MLTQQEIRDLTELSIRSVKGSLILLKKNNLVEESAVLSDMRCKVYKLGGVLNERGISLEEF